MSFSGFLIGLLSSLMLEYDLVFFDIGGFNPF